jgi:hypothetical protein
MRTIATAVVTAALVLPSLALALPASAPGAKGAVSLVQSVQDKKMDAKDDKMAKDKEMKK